MSQSTVDLSNWTASKATRQLLNGVIVRVIAGGPDRVCVSQKGYCETPEQAIQKHGPEVAPIIVYIRNDGWTLGTNAANAPAAFKLWRESWVAAVLVEKGVCPAMAAIVHGVMAAGWKDDPKDMDG